MHEYVYMVCMCIQYVYMVYVCVYSMYVCIYSMYVYVVCIYMYVCNISLANLLPIGIKIIMVVLKTRARPIWVIQ